MPGPEKPLRRWMPKFSLIAKKRLPAGASLSRPTIPLENQRLKFYSAKGNNFFAVETQAIWKIMKGY
ncbi:MAG: hypothetical protein PHD95_03600 [Candidatus ainarchaeum sp.]|nr:hypothetical protein [Candidatus ainarchaeum sp.]